MKIVQLLFIALLFGLFQISCKNEKETDNKCGTSFKVAESLLKEFYDNQDSLILSNLLSQIDSCENFNLKHMKIHISLLLNKCKEGLDFVEGMELGEFKYPYQQVLFESIFNVSSI